VSLGQHISPANAHCYTGESAFELTLEWLSPNTSLSTSGRVEHTSRTNHACARTWKRLVRAQFCCGEERGGG
jgi:hypothetical protein